MLLIIGNGFDINLGLKTKYIDFMSYVNSKPNSELYHTKLFAHFNSALKNSECRWIDLENELKNYVINNLSLIVNANMILATPTELEMPVRKRFDKPELQDKIQKFAKETHREYETLNKTLNNYIKVVVSDSKIDCQSHAAKYIGYLKEKYFRLNEYSTNSNISVLNFNYTNDYTVKKLFEDDNFFISEKEANPFSYDIKRKVYYSKIHGDIDENDIILGIEGKFDLPIYFNFLKKGLKYNYSKGVNIERFLKEHTDIHFYGFSLGETDAPYFRQFFGAYSSPENPFSANLHLEQKRIFFYHYGFEAYTQLISRIDDLTGQNVDRFRQYNYVNFINIEDNKFEF